MNSKSTWVWLGLAATLFAVIVAVEKFGPKPPSGPVPLLPGFQAALVTSVQLGLSDQLEIQAVRTNSHWQLIKPMAYPAQANSIETLLVVLQQLAPGMVIPGSEVRQRKNADQEFGFSKPQATLTLKTGDSIRPILIECAWRLLYFQPNYRLVRKWRSALSKARNTGARRKQIIVALARQFAVDWWRIRTGRTTPEALGLAL